MTDAPNLATNLLSTAVALVVVLLLAWVSLRALKRVQQGRTGTRSDGSEVPQVVRSVGLGPRERLVTMRYRGREYLLGVTAGAVSVVESHEIAVENDATGGATESGWMSHR
ncbi:MAG: flagellar biosynthetic protein FliO [Burkholderiales bacterium]|nr:flagellar biosynthetic protein FliO [Burkholderiales bacterium]